MFLSPYMVILNNEVTTNNVYMISIVCTLSHNTKSTGTLLNYVSLTWDDMTCVTLESWYTNSQHEPLEPMPTTTSTLQATHTRPQTKPKDLNRDGLKVTVKQQRTNRCNFYVLTTNHITIKLTNQHHDRRHKLYHHPTKTIPWAVVIFRVKWVETSVTYNSLQGA